MTTQTDSPITIVPAGPAALTALAHAVSQAQADNRFARVVIIADHHDAARSVRHLLGARGTINVTVQVGRHLAHELARPVKKPLTRLLESQAVRRVAEGQATELGLEPAGRRRFYSSLANAFREMEEREDSPLTGADEGTDGMNRLAEILYADYRAVIGDAGYYTPAELPQIAAVALEGNWKEGSEPAVIYYLPRRMSTGDAQLAKTLLDRGKCRVIAGFTGDADADRPTRELLEKLGSHQDAGTADFAQPDPLRQHAEAGALAIVAAPDPEEEVRTVIRSIAAGDMPFHRIAITYRQDNPYASLLRQELDFAGIPYAGVDYRTLADTPTGRLLLGIVDLATNVNGDGTIDRERLIDWLTTTAVAYQPRGGADGSPRRRSVPATRWANLAVQARANGTVANYQVRLVTHGDQTERQAKERGDEHSEPDLGSRALGDAAELHAFLRGLATDLRALGGGSGMEWKSAARQLKDLVQKYRWASRDEAVEDRQRIDDLLGGLPGLENWGAEYNPSTLQEVIREGLQSPVAERGKPVGAGVYLGPPAGIAGAAYDAVYGVGLVERQFPPRPRTNPWLVGPTTAPQQDAALERYDFLTAIAAADRAVLSWPAATAERSAAYPSRWLIEAANRCHEYAGEKDRLTYESVTDGAEAKPWLTVIPSREAGLRRLSRAPTEPADAADYTLRHLIDETWESLPKHPAIASDARMTNALAARAARGGNALTEWDGLLSAESENIAAIGSRERPISPSALETWASCPYRYFLSRVLGLSAPPEDDDDEISAAERGTLVHKILERFIEEKGHTEAELLALAEAEFADAEARGVTGYHLLWETEKSAIRDALAQFLSAETIWFGEVAPDDSRAEVSFGYPPTHPDDAAGNSASIGEVCVPVEGLGEVWFRGKIDRIDRLGDVIRVRDFKTGKPDRYRSSEHSQDAYTVANGRALQLPVYAAAVGIANPDARVEASYCFPLRLVHDARTYTPEQGMDQFSSTLRRIVGAARTGVFPAAPDGEGQYRNCRYCDFNRLCPSQRRQIWERKAHHDAATVQSFNELRGNAAIGDADDDNN